MNSERISSDPDGDAARRAAILREARSAFMTEGFAAAKMEPIARRAGVSTATLYLLYHGKAELFDAVILDAGEEFGRQFARIGEVDGDARQQLVAFVTAYAGFMADPFVRAVFRLVMAERPRFQTVAMRFFEKGRHDIGGSLIGILHRLAELGELQPLEHPSWAVGQLLGMIEHPTFLVPLVTGDEITVRRTVAEVAEDAVDTFLARYST